MTSPPGADLGPFSSLAERLQEITEALAKAGTQQEVVEIVLTPASRSLGAVAGVVLLVGQAAQQLKVAGRQGHEDRTPTLWKGGPIEDYQLISDILRQREASYFEHAGALRGASPDLESRLGGLAAIATVAAPGLLEARVKDRTRQLNEERRAKEALVAFTEAVGSETDLPALIRQAITVLQGRFPGASVVHLPKVQP